MTDDMKSLAVELAEEIVKYFRPPQVEAIVPLAEAARMLHMKPCTLRKLVYSNRIGFIVDGKQYFFKVSDLNDYINAHYTPAGASTCTNEANCSASSQK